MNNNKKKSDNLDFIVNKTKLIKFANATSCSTIKSKVMSILRIDSNLLSTSVVSIPYDAMYAFHHRASTEDMNLAIKYDLYDKKAFENTVEVNNVFIQNNLDPRFDGNYSGRAIWLSENYNWEIIRDNHLHLILVPTEKEKEL